MRAGGYIHYSYARQIHTPTGWLYSIDLRNARLNAYKYKRLEIYGAYASFVELMNGCSNGSVFWSRLCYSG